MSQDMKALLALLQQPWNIPPAIQKGLPLSPAAFSLTLLLFSRKVLSGSCDTMGCRLPGSSVHGILQTRILEWVAISFSRGSSQPRVGTQVSCIAGIFFTI